MECNSSVVVAELGCFTIVDKPSEIQEGVIIPPLKTIQLDSENTNDDRVFSSYVANKEKITLEQATEDIQLFYQQFKKLTLARSITIEEFGTFSLDEYANIVFEPDANFFKKNYGLDNVYFSDNAQQPLENPVVPEPGPEPVPVPEPVSAFVSEPVQPPPPPPPPPVEPLQPETKETVDTQQEPNESLFDTGNNTRFRENKTRRSTNFEKQKPPAKPTPKPVPKKTTPKVKSTNSNLWVLWVLLAAAGLGFAAYYYFPTIYPMLFSPSQTTVVNFVDEEEEIFPVDTDDADETDESMPNTEISQTLDEATDKKNALNPESNQQTATSTQQTQTPSSSQTSSSSQTQSSPATATTSTPVTDTKPANVTPIQNNTGRGKYLLVVASLTTRSAAEKHVRKLQAEGLECEIVDAGEQRFRVSVASFDNLAEAKQQANQMKSRPYCEGVWVVRR